MNQRNAVLISNPNAGRGGARRAREVASFCARLKSLGVRVEVLHTAGPGDATQITRTVIEQGAREIIISGGDGTINEALQGLVGTGAHMGIWPSGTANVLARELGLPFDTERLAEIIAGGHARRIYPGCAVRQETGERRYFCLMAGIGLDASIVSGVRPRMKRRIGQAAFWYTGLGHLAHWRPVPFEVEVEGQSFPATFAAIGKAAHYGGELSITPHARLDQPDFEICLIDSQSRLRYLRLLSQAMRGGMKPGKSGAQLLRATRAQASGPAFVQVDGELIGPLPMSFEIAPNPIEIITAKE